MMSSTFRSSAGSGRIPREWAMASRIGMEIFLTHVGHSSNTGRPARAVPETASQP